MSPSRTFLIAAPLVWAVVLLFHPVHDPGDVYGSLRDQTTAWLTVHIATLPLIALLGAALYMLVRDLPGTAARVARLAIVPFVLFYGAAEAILGIATGVRVQQAVDASAGLRATSAEAAQALWDNPILAELLPGVGAAAWVTAATAAAIAYRRTNAPFAVSALQALSTLVALHAPPIGPFALVCFAAAVVILARRQTATGVESPAVAAHTT